jgi:2-polyprenyl-3-methyl-5-hydroxy-6-metoxy-1,4-benzoquinol methylase
MTIRQQLIDLKIIEDKNLQVAFESKKVRMLQDKISRVIFMDHDPPIDYSKIESLSYWGTSNLSHARASTRLDDERRFKQLASHIKGKHILDFGCGNGGFLDLCRDWAYHAKGYEIQRDAVEILRRDGLSVSNDLPIDQFDTIFMFHVFEHLTEPMQTLDDIKERLAPGGMLIIEVPHANDFLLEFLEVPEFKAHTFHSEYHTILHTQESLRIMLEHAGFRSVSIEGFQRYSINNHLHWLKEKRGRGMRGWDFLLSDELKNEYAKSMERLGFTDTLIAVAYV